MATVNIKINNKEYPVECDDSQKDNIEQAGEKLKSRFDELRKLSPMATPDYLMFLCALSAESSSLSARNSNPAEFDELEHKKLETLLSEINQIAKDLNLIMKK